MAHVVSVDFHRPQPEEQIASWVREARRRTGMSPAQFAAAIGCGMTAERILLYESGDFVPRANVYLRALALGGLDWQYGMAMAFLGAAAHLTAGVTPWW